LANHLRTTLYQLKKARAELIKALEILEGDSGGSKIEINQHLDVTDELAEVFRDKPVIIIQTMDVRILQVNNQINSALRALDKVDAKQIALKESYET
jgi:hypothetical protein